MTDEVRTYAIFNYEWMGWTTHTEAGGDTTQGEGGVPAEAAAAAQAGSEHRARRDHAAEAEGRGGGAEEAGREETR